MKPIKKVKFSWKEKEYWSQVLIACSQVSFGLFWASLFVPIDKGKLIMFIIKLNTNSQFIDKRMVIS